MPRLAPVEATLRQRIVEGEYPPGSRLPVRVEIEREFSAATLTVQRALDRLDRDGFIVARGRGGTFVTEHPPHLFRYGMVFHTSPASRNAWGRFYEAIAGEARDWEKIGPRRFKAYHSISPHEDEETFQVLRGDVRAGRLAGIILMVPWVFAESSLLDDAREFGVPIIGVTDVRSVPAEMPRVSPMQRRMIERSLDHFARIGRKRIALVCNGGDTAYIEEFRLLAAQRRLIAKPHWLHSVSPYTPEQAGRITALLARCNDAPDALLITDDNLVEHATLGLRGAGVRADPARGGLAIVAHANFPFTTTSALRAVRIGFDLSSVLAAAVSLIDRGRRGGRLPKATRIEPLFEHELPHARTMPPILVAPSSSKQENIP